MDIYKGDGREEIPIHHPVKNITEYKTPCTTAVPFNTHSTVIPNVSIYILVLMKMPFPLLYDPQNIHIHPVNLIPVFKMNPWLVFNTICTD